MAASNKTAVIKFRVTPDEKESFKMMADRHDMSLSEYIRRLSMVNGEVKAIVPRSFSENVSYLREGIDVVVNKLVESGFFSCDPWETGENGGEGGAWDTGEGKE